MKLQELTMFVWVYSCRSCNVKVYHYEERLNFRCPKCGRFTRKKYKNNKKGGIL